MDVFAEYQEEAWPTREQVHDLPPSLTGLGLDQPFAVIQAATIDIDRPALAEVMSSFCSTYPGEDGHACGCTAMNVEGFSEDEVSRRRVDAHLTAESIAVERLFAIWVLQHEGPEMGFNGTPVGQYVERFSEYDI